MQQSIKCCIFFEQWNRQEWEEKKIFVRDKTQTLATWVKFDIENLKIIFFFFLHSERRRRMMMIVRDTHESCNALLTQFFNLSGFFSAIFYLFTILSFRFFLSLHANEKLFNTQFELRKFFISHFTSQSQYYVIIVHKFFSLVCWKWLHKNTEKPEISINIWHQFWMQKNFITKRNEQWKFFDYQEY
jgi:hypothetical protein